MKISSCKKYKTLSILLIEDYLPLQKKLSTFLDDYFDYVQAASNGAEGLIEYKKYQQTNNKFFDIVMTDYDMPKLNGIELIKVIQKENKDQIFVVISAHQNPEYLIEYINLGVLHFISKPVAYDSILKILDKIYDKFIKRDNLFYINSSLAWDKNRKSLFCEGQLINLSRYDLLLIEVLLDDFGFICHNEKIIDHFYLNNEDIKLDNIRNMVVRLRKKIPDMKIESVYGIGYRIIS